jgi:hypothetical protein
VKCEVTNWQLACSAIRKETERIISIPDTRILNKRNMSYSNVVTEADDSYCSENAYSEPAAVLSQHNGRQHHHHRHHRQQHHYQNLQQQPQQQRRVLPITFAEQHGSHSMPRSSGVRERESVLPAAKDVGGYSSNSEYQVAHAHAASLRSSCGSSGRSSAISSSIPSTTVTYMTKKTTLAGLGLFRKRNTVIDCGVYNKFDNG